MQRRWGNDPTERIQGTNLPWNSHVSWDGKLRDGDTGWPSQLDSGNWSNGEALPGPARMIEIKCYGNTQKNGCLFPWLVVHSPFFMVVSPFQSPHWLTGLVLSERTSPSRAQGQFVLYTQITSQITWNVHAPLQFALLGVSKLPPPGMALNRKESVLTPPSPTILQVPHPGWVRNTTNQPWVHCFSACTSCRSFEPNSCSRFHWLKGQGSNWFGDWLRLMDVIPIMYDEVRIPLSQIVECPWMPGGSLNEMPQPFNSCWFIRGSLPSKNNSGFKLETHEIHKSQQPEGSEPHLLLTLALRGSGATELLLVPGNVPPKVWKHRPPSAAMSTPASLFQLLGTTMTKTHQKSNLAARKSLLQANVPSFWMPFQLPCFISLFSCLYTRFCCFNLNFSRFNSPILLMKPSSTLVFAGKNHGETRDIPSFLQRRRILHRCQAPTSVDASGGDPTNMGI